jgi:Zn-dependent protease with chaperone function
MLRTNRTSTTRAAATAIALLSSVTLVIGQTQIVAPENKYSISEDVTAGREASRQVEEQLPIMNDSQVQSYISNIGARLAESIPREFQHSEFHYTFKVVNVSDINAFALPGGPMYVNRGMIEAAKTEGEVAGVMAHEMSHVALRHGTAQASKATKYEVGSVLGQIAGAVLGGTLGQVVSYGTQFGLGTAFSRFSREYEKQADILGSHIMASAGYDPRDMANMFKTIEKISGNGGPQWMSDHPNPSNRYQYINDEANMLRVTNPIRDSRAFVDVQTRLRRMSPAPTTEQATKQGGNRRSSQGGRYPEGGQIGRVDPPSAQTRTYEEGNLFRIAVPANWQELPSNTTVTFAPQGGYGDFQGQSVFTHGMEVGTSRNESHDLRTATDELVSALSQSNPRLQGRSSYNSISIAGRRGLHTVLNNVSDATRQQEQIELFTAQLNDGTLFYVIGVAPTNEFGTYQRVFNQVVRSIQLNSTYSNSRY